MNPEQVYKKYLKRALKDPSDKKTMDYKTFIQLWDLSEAFRKEIVKYVKETETL